MTISTSHIKKLFLLLTFQICILFPSHAALARWSSFEEADYRESFQLTYHIKKDGTYTLVKRLHMIVLTEQGREGLSTISFPYPPELFQVSDIHAKVRNYNEETIIDESQISNLPLAHDNSAFDNKNMITVAFPKVEINSELFLNYKLTNLVNQFPGQFSFREDFAYRPLQQGSSITFISELPLTVFTKNTSSLIAITESRTEDGMYKIEVTLLDHIFFKAVEEKYGDYPSSALPILEISTAKNYEEIFLPFVAAYEQKINQPLPQILQDILSAAPSFDFKREENFYTQANMIMASIRDKIRYMGDMRTIHGLLIPQDLAQIADKGYGDCKDFTSIVVRLLRELGYQTYPALVYRSPYPFIMPHLPLLYAFNHAIVYVHLNGKDIWLDPTNPMAFSQGVRLDIAQRPALVLSKSIELKNIGLPDPQENSFSKNSTYTFKEGNLVSLQAQTLYRGTNANSFLENFYGTNHNLLIHYLLNSLSQERKILVRRQVNIHPLHSKISQDYRWEVDIDHMLPLQKTTSGEGFNLVSSFNYLSKVDAETYVNGIFLGLPMAEEEMTTFKNRKLVSPAPIITCEITSPWLNFNRTIKQMGKDIVVEEKIIQKAYAITNEELKSATFQQLQTNLEACANQYTLIFNPWHPHDDGIHTKDEL